MILLVSTILGDSFTMPLILLADPTVLGTCYLLFERRNVPVIVSISDHYHLNHAFWDFMLVMQ